jgi:Zn-dependent protease
MPTEFEVLPLQAPPPKPRQGLAGAATALGILALKFKTVLSMGFSIWVYSFAWGWPFAIGFVLLIFVHEMGHVIAAKLLGIPVSAPLFIPFIGASIVMKQHPRDAWTEALMAYGGPLAGTLGGLMVWGVAAQGQIPWLLAVARATFFINLFNLIPLPPLDGGRICAAVSPWFWFIGLLLLGCCLFAFRVSPLFLVLAVIILAAALPRLKQTFRLRNSPAMQAYYAVHPAKRLFMAGCYVGLIIVLLLSYLGANESLLSLVRGY